LDHARITEQEFGRLISAEMIAGIVAAIVQRFSPDKIILFGSYAKGDPTPDSDLDLLVITATDLPHRKRAVALQLFFRPMPCAMDILVFTPEEIAKWNGTVNHIATIAIQAGKVLYEREPT